MTPRAALTAKQRMVIDYMRGNGSALTTAGWQHLVRRGSFTSRGLSQVVGRLVDDGYIDFAHRPAPEPRYTLTAQGRRA